VAAKLTVDRFGSACEVVYCNTLASEHPDNARFLDDVGAWLGRSITVIRSAKYKTVDDVFEKTRYMAGIRGARCTTEMKKVPREAFQRESDVHVFGYSLEERARAEAFEERNQGLHVEWPLIDAGIKKAECFRIIEGAGIALPAMYSLGFKNNNCIGCVKATSAGYWNRVRRLFPDVFARRAAQSRAIGARLVRIGGTRSFLDELPADAEAPDDEGIECGPVCQQPSLFPDGW